MPPCRLWGVTNAARCSSSDWAPVSAPPSSTTASSSRWSWGTCLTRTGRLRTTSGVADLRGTARKNGDVMSPMWSSVWSRPSNPTKLCSAVATLKNSNSCLQVAAQATTPTHFVEDFACGTSHPPGSIPPTPNRIPINGGRNQSSRVKERKAHEYKRPHQAAYNPEVLEIVGIALQERQQIPSSRTVRH